MKRTVGELASNLGAVLSDGSDGRVTGVAIDSRAVRPGDLFVALPGERVDGHEFVVEAAHRGAAAALVSRIVAAELPQLVVPDTLAALQRLAGAERAHSRYRVAAVTGSLGKTSTKEFLAALLATTFTVGATTGSRNSQAGFPAELCNQPQDLGWMVAELGMNHAGELDRLGAIARPDALVYTTIAPVHLEFFSDLDEIAEAKAELIRHLNPSGLLVLNSADPRIVRFATRFSGRSVYYGEPGRSDAWLEDYRSRGLLGSRFVLRAGEVQIEVDWAVAGRHQADNLLAATTCGLHLGVPAEVVAPCAAALKPAPRRGEIHRLDSGVTVIDDSYNASPVATARLLDLLGETPGRRLAVLGEMLELGDSAPVFHREIGERAAAIADIVVAVGGDNAAVVAAAARSTEAHHVADASAALELVRSLLQQDDVVLVKGSRGIALDRLVDGLVEAG